MVHMLLVAGADPKCWNNAGDSPLSLAVKAGCADIVQALIHGCVHVDSQVYARSRSSNNPLYECFMKGQFFLAKVLLMNGYRGVTEVRHFLSMDSREWDNFRRNPVVSVALTKDEEVESLQFIQSFGCDSLPLQQLCRNAVRNCLENRIWEKVRMLHLPKSLMDCIVYKDVYRPPRLSTEREINLYFDDNGRELN